MITFHTDSSPPLIYVDEVYTYLVSQFTLVAWLMTFGAVFPLLTIPFLITIYRRMFFFQSVIGRYIAMFEYRYY